MMAVRRAAPRDVGALIQLEEISRKIFLGGQDFARRFAVDRDTRSSAGWQELRRVRRRALALHWNQIYRQSTTLINTGVFRTPARDAEAATRYT
jgi:hypothetical protein